MKPGRITLMVVLVLVATVLTAAERRYPGPSVQESNYQMFRHLGPDDTIVNLPGGESARDEYRLNKMRDRMLNKMGVNQLRRRRSAMKQRLLVQTDDDDNQV